MLHLGVVCRKKQQQSIDDKQSGIDPEYISMLISKTNTSANLYLYQYYTPIHY
jgi:hypothetical protein